MKVGKVDTNVNVKDQSCFDIRTAADLWFTKIALRLFKYIIQEMDPGFIKGDSDNLPSVDYDVIHNFYIDNTQFLVLKL